MTEWFELSLDHLPTAKARKVPKWARRLAVTEDGTIYVPAVLAGGEMEVFLCAGYDGTSAILDGKHAYYPADWMAREFPATRPTIERMRENIAAAISRSVAR